jgi:hypothetical protein
MNVFVNDHRVYVCVYMCVSVSVCINNIHVLYSKSVVMFNLIMYCKGKVVPLQA